MYAASRLGSVNYGAFILASTTVLTVSSISSLGLPLAATKLIAEARGARTGREVPLIRGTLMMTAALGVIATLGMIVMSPFVSDEILGQTELTGSLRAGAVLLLVSPLADVLTSVMAGLELFSRLAAYRIIRAALSAAALCIAASGSTVPTLLLMVAGAEAASCFIGVALVGRPTRSTSPHEVRRCFRPLLRIGVPALLAGAALQVALWLGQLMLSRQPDGLSEVGVFAVAYRWHLLAVFLPAVLGSVLLPILGRMRGQGNEEQARRLSMRFLGWTAVAAVPLAFGTFALASTIMSAQGPEYAGGATVLAVLALAVIPNAVNNVLSQMALAENRLALWLASDVVLAAGLVAAARALIPSFGATGLSWACLVAYLLTCLVLLPVLVPPRHSQQNHLRSTIGVSARRLGLVRVASTPVQLGRGGQDLSLGGGGLSRCDRQRVLCVASTAHAQSGCHDHGKRDRERLRTRCPRLQFGYELLTFGA